MTAVYASGTNTFVVSHDATQNMVVDYARNIEDFPVNQYAQIRKVDKVQGYWLSMTVEEAGRILNSNLADFEWPDGTVDPEANDGTEAFEFLAFLAKRYRFGFNLGYLASGQAGWDIIAQHSSIKARQAMTARTQKVVTAMTTSGSYDASHTSAVSSITGVSGKWDVSTTARQDIKRSLDHAAETIYKDTLGAVTKKDLNLVLSPGCLRKISVAQEIVDLLKGSPSAYGWIRGALAGEKVDYEVPKELYGYRLVVENTVKVTSRKGGTVARSFVLGDTTPALISRVGALEAKIPSQAPTFSSLTLFMQEEMTVETRDDPDNRRTKGRVVECFDVKLTAPASSFLFTAAVA